MYKSETCVKVTGRHLEMIKGVGNLYSISKGGFGFVGEEKMRSY